MSKRALVVDDSRSSRLFLGKLLVEQQLQVDEVDSAEAAMEYLGRSTPDVIFMDHLMPGMDGFQAVQAIKSNPRTAQIPVFMYTSQEGELYLGQAQALGAAGVVAKGATDPDQLAKLLGALWVSPAPESAIVVEPHTVAQIGSPAPVAAPPQPEAAVVAEATPAPVVAAPVATLSPEQWRSEIAVLREQFSGALEMQRTALAADLRALLQEARQGEPAPVIQPEKPRHSPLAWTLAVLAAVAAGVCGTLYWQGDAERAALRAELASSREAVALLAARLAPVREAESPALDEADAAPAAQGEPVAVPTSTAPAAQTFAGE